MDDDLLRRDCVAGRVTQAAKKAKKIERSTPGPRAAAEGLKLAPNRQAAEDEAALAESQGQVSGPAGAATKPGLPPARTLDSKIKRLRINKYRFKVPHAI